MPSYFTSLFDNLRSVIATTWPEVLPAPTGNGGGIWDAVELAAIPWERKAETGELPLVVIDYGAVPSREWGLDNRVDSVDASIYYVQPSAGGVDALVGKLEALRTALWPDDGSEALTAGQVTEYPQISWSVALPVNQYFLGQQKPFWGGAVIVQILVGVSP